MDKQTKECLQEFINFLEPGAYESNIQIQALEYLIPFLLSPESLELTHTFLLSDSSLLSSLSLMITHSSSTLAQLASKALLALSTSSVGRKQMLSSPKLVDLCMETLPGLEPLQTSSLIKLLANLTIEEPGQVYLFKPDSDMQGIHLLRLLDWFRLSHSSSSSSTVFDSQGKVLDAYEYTANILTNLCRLPQARTFFLDERRNLLPELVAQMSAPSPVRRLGVLAALRNLCFQLGQHAFLLQARNGFLAALVSPLVASDLIDTAEFEKMPAEVQALWSPSKERDSDERVRRLVLETVEILVRVPETRKLLKDELQMYAIFREYEKWEENEEVYDLLDEVVQWFIMDEPVDAEDRGTVKQKMEETVAGETQETHSVE